MICRAVDESLRFAYTFGDPLALTDLLCTPAAVALAVPCLPGSRLIFFAIIALSVALYVCEC